MSLSRNFLAGMANSTWSAVVGLAAVPFYLKYLGIESYGLIGFFATIQAVLNLLDMGMAPTINREVARCAASGNLREAGKLLHTLAVVYWSMAGAIAFLILIIAPLIAEYWLQSKQLSPETISHAVMLMGLVVACRWPIGLYQGALIGAQRLTVSSGINMAMVTIGSLGAVAVLAFVSPTIEAFFTWQACVGVLYAATMRWAAWRVIGRGEERFMREELKRIWRFSAVVGGTTVAGLILTQTDKVLLSRMISLEDFGRYALAGMVAGGLSILISPAFSVIYPRFSALVGSGNSEGLTQLYRFGTRMLCIILFPIAFSVAFFSNDLLFVWTGNSPLAASTAPLVMLLTIGTSLNGIMYFPYALQLACGMAWLPFLIAIALTLVLIPLIIFLVLYYGVLGGAAAWLVLNIIYLPFGTWLTHRYLLKGLGMKWLLEDVGLPLALSGLVIGIGGNWLAGRAWEHHTRLFFAGGLAVFTMLILLAVSTQLRSWIMDNYRRAI